MRAVVYGVVLRVAVLSWRAPGDPDAGGSELHSREILSRWTADGVEVTLHARHAPDDTVLGRGCPFDVVPVGSTYSVFAAAPRRVIARRRRFDAVVEILNGVPFWSPLWWRGPRVVWLHHMHTEMWSQTLPRPVSDIGRWNELTVVPRVYRSTPVVTLAETGRAELRHAGFGRVEVIEPGVDERFNRGDSFPAPESSRLVAVGRLAPVKRWFALLEAVAPLADRRPGLTLDLVGDGPERSAIEEWAQRRDARWLTVHGHVDDETLVDLYRRATLVVSASSAEGWGMTITEAARCGVPSVVTDVLGHRAAVIDGVTGDLVTTPADLAGAIERLLDDADRRDRYGRAAMERAHAMTWDRAANRHLELLRGCL
jgi:glycosyltransferase involved in cell wall biosynthesis